MGNCEESEKHDIFYGDFIWIIFLIISFLLVL